MDIKTRILDRINNEKQIKSAKIIKETGFSRTYINRALQELRDEGKIILLGKANKTIYVLADSKALEAAKADILDFNEVLLNTDLREDEVLKTVKQKTGIFASLHDNISNIVEFAFLEMLNNAIEHSRGKQIRIKLKRENQSFSFMVEDNGIGIFNSLKEKFGLPSNLAAIQQLLKGKQTTEPEHHTGQGIFFTSKMADNFVIRSSDKSLIVNNIIKDLFIEDRKTDLGTVVNFTIDLHTKRTAQKIFAEYTNEEYEFTKTKVLIKLFKVARNLLSRSEARRVLLGLDEFKDIVLDFAEVETVGQSFADEIFRVWQNIHPEKKISYINTNENVEFMIKRAL